MFNQIFRFINPESNPLQWPPPTFDTSTFTRPNRTTPHHGHRPLQQRQYSRRVTRTFTDQQHRHPHVNPRNPSRGAWTRPPTNQLSPPLQEFINNNFTEETTDIPRPTTIRQFFDNCNIFIYNIDLSNNQIRCPISMTDFSNTDVCVSLPCNHIFKMRPLLQWLAINRTCPMCRAVINSLTRHDTTIDLTTNNVSIQTADISGGFITDISANNINDLSSALSRTVQERIQTLFQNIDLSNNALPVAWSTNISLVTPRSLAQSPIENLFPNNSHK